MGPFPFRKIGIEFFISILVPEIREWNLPFPFPFPRSKSHSCSRLLPRHPFSLLSQKKKTSLRVQIDKIPTIVKHVLAPQNDFGKQKNKHKQVWEFSSLN